MTEQKEYPIPDIKGGNILKFYINFLYYNPLKTENKGWTPIPQGMTVKMYDHDTVSKDDFCGQKKTDGKKPVLIEYTKEEDNPDVYFIIETNKKYINLSSNTTVDKINNPSSFPFIALPDSIDSRDKKDTNDKEGYLKGYEGKGEGTEEEPWTFKLEDFRIFIQLMYFDSEEGKTKPVPKGLVVSVFDYDWFSRNDLQAVGCTWNEGKLYLPIYKKDEDNPDIFFSIKNKDDLYLDKKNATYVKKINEKEKNLFLKIPNEWCSKDFNDASGSKGIKESHKEMDVGSWSSPWVFNLLGDILELKWDTETVVAKDGEKKDNRKTKIIVKTRDIDESKAEVKIYQYVKGKKPTEIDKITNLKIKNNELVDGSDKPVEYSFEWHNTIYDYKKTQYLFEVEIGDLNRVLESKKDKMIQLIHLDGIVANPDDSLNGAKQEGEWAKDYFEDDGPWIEATEDKLHDDGHEILAYIGKSSSVTKNKFKTLCENSKFIHHQASHGHAKCYNTTHTPTYVTKKICEDCNKPYPFDSLKECPSCKSKKVKYQKGADNVINYRCPKCGNIIKTMGLMNLETETYEKSDVDALTRSPKTLVFANCCLTAITKEFPEAWNKKGTRWYIGWAVPVSDSGAVEFAKKFYKSWFEKYKMDPSKVKTVFDSISGAYWMYRPRIYGA